MDAKRALPSAERYILIRRHNCSLPDNGCSDLDNSTDDEQAKYETVRVNSAAETEVQDQQIYGLHAQSLRTEWAPERRGTARYFHQQNQRLKSLNVGGGATMNRTAETRFALQSGRLAAS